MIILVIVQTFLDDYSVYKQWDIKYRNYLMFFGLYFDIVFSLEFVVRTISAIRDKDIKGYWLHNRGWVDFLSSFPLLLLNSGPAVFIFMYGGSTGMLTSVAAMNVLKVVKAVRVTRILRLIRIVKIFGKIQNTDSAMAQYHSTKISTISVFAIIITLIMFPIFFKNPIDGLKTYRENHFKKVIDNIDSYDADNKDLSRHFLMSDPNLISVQYDGEMIYQIDDIVLKTKYNYDDYVKIDYKSFVILVSVIDINSTAAYNNMESLFIIIFLITAIIIIYTKLFAQSISDVVHVMNLGFRKKNYNLNVIIPERMENHEIFKLAEFYNDSYIPAKIKRLDSLKSQTTGKVSLNDFLSYKK